VEHLKRTGVRSYAQILHWDKTHIWVTNATAYVCRIVFEEEKSFIRSAPVKVFHNVCADLGPML